MIKWRRKEETKIPDRSVVEKSLSPRSVYCFRFGMQLAALFVASVSAGMQISSSF